MSHQALVHATRLIEAGHTVGEAAHLTQRAGYPVTGKLLSLLARRYGA